MGRQPVALNTALAIEAAGVIVTNSAKPGAFVAAEVPRMAAVNRMWPIYLSTWAILSVVGLVLRFGVRTPWALGLGAGLMFFGAVGVLIDGFAEARAKPYTTALSNLAPSSSSGS